MTADDPGPNHVRGERAENLVARGPSLQSRLSNFLAVALMCALGLGTLTWYYAHAMTRAAPPQPAATSRAQGELPLPSLGRIDAPAPVETLPLGDTRAAESLAEVPLAPSPPASSGGAPAPQSAEELAATRRLSGTVFALQSAGLVAPVAASPILPTGAASPSQDRGEIGAWLHPTATPAAVARTLPARRLLLPKGSFLDCTLETAIDSTLPGMTTCVIATDAFGVDGNVVLLERGTKLIGETRGQVQRGAARLFVLWTEARTPTGVVVPLDSPGTDELGRSGLAGEARTHFWERFGAALLVSVIDGAVQAAAQSSHGGSGNVVVNPSTSQDVLTEILKNTIDIPPTIIKHNGDRIAVLVARDVDFRFVYELRSTSLDH